MLESNHTLYHTVKITNMTRGYKTGDLKERLVDLLRSSKTGLSGVEISERLGVSRVTMTKYLGIFAAEGMINQKNTGNVTLWFVDDDVEQYRFPDDYHVVQKKFSELVSSFSKRQAHSIIRNCLHSGATVSKLSTEVVLPSIGLIRDLFNEGKIGAAEENLLKNIVSECIGIMGASGREENAAKNAIVLAADPESHLVVEAASASYRSQGWNVFSLGDMSSAADVLFDLDLQKLLSKVWKKRTGIMVVSVFSDSEEGLKFFADAIGAVKEKTGKRLFSVMSGPVGKSSSVDADLVSDDLHNVLEWSESVFESNVGD